MAERILFENESIRIIAMNSDVKLVVIERGHSLIDFQEILLKYPRISVTQFAFLKDALDNGTHKPVTIGFLKPEIEITISQDRLKAFVKVNLCEEEFAKKTKLDYLDQILEIAEQEGIVYGIDWQNITDRIVANEVNLLAMGKLPENGKDAVVKLYEIKEKKPEIYENGDVNYYELNLINKVEVGEWLGERIDPTQGIPGKTVFGEIIPAMDGQQEPLNYDSKTVAEVYDSQREVTTLVAKIRGAVVLENDKVSVNSFMHFPNDISFETGNVDFDGFVEVKNTVIDNFSVIATKDIQIMGDLGIGAVNTIESKNGNIYIRGGISGKDRAKIVCKGDLYTKYASNCTIECSGIVNIGYYAMNCKIKAKEIIFEALNSKLIGGETEAEYKIDVGEIGSFTSAKTKVVISGFKRSDVKKEYDLLESALNKLKDKIALVKKKIAIYSTNQNLSNEQKKIYDLLLDEQDKYNETLKVVLSERSRCLTYLKTKGEGEINVKRRVNGNVLLIMKEERHIINEPINTPVRYYLSDSQIKWS